MIVDSDSDEDGLCDSEDDDDAFGGEVGVVVPG